MQGIVNRGLVAALRKVEIIRGGRVAGSAGGRPDDYSRGRNLLAEEQPAFRDTSRGESVLRAPKIGLTTLDNGLRVVTEESFSQFAHVGLILDAGSVDEGDLPLGTAHLYERMFWSSNQHATTEQNTETFGEIGSQPISNLQRETLSVSADLFSSYVPAMVQAMVDALKAPLFLEPDVNREKQALMYETELMNEQPFAFLTEALHEVAFDSEYARPILKPVTGPFAEVQSALVKYHALGSDPSRVIIGATGVQHEPFLELVAKHFGGHRAKEGKRVADRQRASTNYVGGVHHAISIEQRMEDKRAHQLVTQRMMEEMYGNEDALHHLNMEQKEPEFSHVVIGFSGPAMLDPDFHATCVLNTLLGGGGSFSAGGPGKGMYARMYLNVLNKQHWINHAQSFFNPYRQSSLFGVYAECQHESFWDLVETLVTELLQLIKNPPNPVELTRAKNLLKSAIFSNLDLRAVGLDDLLRQTLYYGQRKPFEVHIHLIDAVTVDDILRVVSKMVSQPPTVVSHTHAKQQSTYDIIPVLKDFFKQ